MDFKEQENSAADAGELAGSELHKLTSASELPGSQKHVRSVREKLALRDANAAT